MKPILSASDLSKEFESAGGTRVTALSDVAFEIWENEFVCIVGSNGSGKTTLLNLICREISPTSGTLCFRGHDITNLPLANWLVYLGRIYQNPTDGLALHLTAEENLLLSFLKGRTLRLLSHSYSRGNRKKLRVALERVHIDFEFSLDQKVIELSGGQRQLLSLMMVYLQAPGILVLDEPTASLDPQNSENVMNLLTCWANNRACTIVMVTHQVEVALSLTMHRSRTLVLHQGRIIAELTAENIRSLSVDSFKENYYA